MIEQTILANLFLNEEYVRKVIPFIKDAYFSEEITRQIFKHINEFIIKFNKCPSKEALLISVEKDKTISEDHYSDIVHFINDISKKEENVEW